MGPAQVRIDNRTVEATGNWAQITGLQPDTAYDYEVDVNGRRIGGGRLRTWAENATRLSFFVIGDYGTGDSAQREIAAAMVREYQRRAGAADPIRFVLSVGDNIYADINLGFVQVHSGAEDRDWDSKFFSPYRDLIRSVPFLPTLGNHDGNSSDSRGDLAVYLDNFFFPGSRPARWYQFSYGGLADFFALDSTDITATGPTAPAYAPGGAQSRWLSEVLPASRAPWRIPYFHHPPFNAGPGHGGSYRALKHWVDLFANNGVRVVFSGHEHNFQVSEDSDATAHTRYIISGAGGQLRPGDVRAKLTRARMEGWAPQRHFLVVEIDGREMRVTPLSTEPVVVRKADGGQMPMPITIRLP